MGSMHGVSLGSGEELLSQPRTEWPGPPSGTSGCRDPDTPRAAAAREASANLRKPDVN